MIRLYRSILLRVRRKYTVSNYRFSYCSNSGLKNENILRIRNIGIMAHIDAGKTTTTERMLYYSGKINRMGEVHEGTTITDYLEQERDRGITITSASVALPWMNHQINIIDTPGHIDFTFEVEQCLAVIDSAIVILDGSAGVEAQTLTVWRQSDKYDVPRIVYVNKMDRMDSSLEFCLQSLKSNFETEFLPLQIPVRGTKSGISAIVDVINGDLLTWSGEQGEKVTRTRILETDRLYEKTQDSRNKLIDKLSDLDDDLTNQILRTDSIEKVTVESIYDALRRITVSRKGVPVLCGSSYKNIGVQKVLDAVVNILPSPNIRKDLNFYKYFGEDLSAKAFKIVHDKQRGPITFLRIYSGSLKKGQKVYNIYKEKSEPVQRLMVALADDYEDVQEITEGNIAAVSGFKIACSGDVVTTSLSAVKTAVQKLASEKKITLDESELLLFPELKSPEPVFFCSIEAPSSSFEVALDNALEKLQREDPSLKVKIDPDTHQTVLGGMGELHLEIIKDRIRKQYKIDVFTGPLQIAYKERITSSAKDESTLEINLGPSRYKVYIMLSILPRKDEHQPFIQIDNNIENRSNTSDLTLKQISLIKSGVESAILQGPKVGCPIVNACFMLHRMETKKFTTESVISSAAAQCTQKLLQTVSTVLVEPLMRIEVIVPDKYCPFVMSDLANRRAEISDFDARGESRIIKALAPLSELLGYSKSLRIGTSGTAVFSMEFECYRELSGNHEKEAIKNITGFY